VPHSMTLCRLVRVAESHRACSTGNVAPGGSFGNPFNDAPLLTTMLIDARPIDQGIAFPQARYFVSKPTGYIPHIMLG
jgi:hypothetical protein